MSTVLSRSRSRSRSMSLYILFTAYTLHIIQHQQGQGQGQSEHGDKVNNAVSVFKPKEYLWHIKSVPVVTVMVTRLMPRSRSTQLPFQILELCTAGLGSGQGHGQLST